MRKKSNLEENINEEEKEEKEEEDAVEKEEDNKYLIVELNSIIGSLYI